MTKPQVAIVMGSDSDLEVMQEAARTLDEFGVTYEMCIASAHRSPELTETLAKNAHKQGIPDLMRPRKRWSTRHLSTFSVRGIPR